MIFALPLITALSRDIDMFIFFKMFKIITLVFICTNNKGVFECLSALKIDDWIDITRSSFDISLT